MNLHASKFQLIAERSNGSRPLGVPVYDDRLVWGNFGSRALQSSDKAGQDVQTVYSRTHRIRQLDVGISSVVQTRVNHCGRQTCAGGI